MDLPGYDAWKLRSPYDDWDEEPEFHCEECGDTGFQSDGDRVELCHCQSPCDIEDAYERTDIDFIYTAREH